MEKKDLFNLIDAKHSNIINNENDTDVVNNENVMNGAPVIDEVNNNAQEPELPVELFLAEDYEFRYNVLSNKTEVRARKQQEWHHLDKKRLDSLPECEVPRGQEIDNSVEIDYEQLYAQVQDNKNTCVRLGMALQR